MAADDHEEHQAARELADLARRAGATLDAWEETRDAVLGTLDRTRESVEGLSASIDNLASKEELAAVNKRATRNTVAIAVLLVAVVTLVAVFFSGMIADRNARHRSDREVNRVVCEIGRKIDETVDHVLNRFSSSTTTSTTVKGCS